MNADVVGKVHNTRLASKDGVMALFEAIYNSMQSIEDAKIEDGKILIELIRSKSLFEGQKDSVLPIDSIVITDNGIGFGEDNFTSFLSSDSTYKLNRGGKGIGRFSWLKVFDHASIRSVFVHNGTHLRRSFQFINNKEAIAEEKFETAPKGTLETIVSLNNIKSEYLEKFPRTFDEISDKIIEHLIIRLVSNSCPSITLRDVSVSPTIEVNINDKFLNYYLLDKESDSFNINGYTFSVGLLKVKAKEKYYNHSIYLSGNDRVVTSTSISKYIPNLVEPLVDLQAEEIFCIKALVTSDYLDSHVNNERTKFFLRTGNNAETNGDVFNEITLKQIENEAAEIIKEQFEVYLNGLREEKKTRLEQIVFNDFPHYIPLLGFNDVIDSITAAQLHDKNKLNLALQKAKYDMLLDARRETNDLKIQMDNISEANATPEVLSEYKNGFNLLVGKLNAITKTELSEYIIHRRMLIEIFERVLSKRGDGTYPWEQEIHNLIFPMGESSETMLGMSQNLWLIDERLSYHRFVASDQSLDKSKKKSKKPDVLVGKAVSTGEKESFNIPVAYSDGEKFAEYDSMVILEFKRAMRKEYSGEKDPINQIKNYIREIRSGNAVHPNGRPILVSKNCRFFAYLICDITPALKNEIEEMHEFTPMVEGNGLFALKEKLNTYMEVISYDKILDDSVKRNNVLFEKLKIDFKSH
jgi:hypothetical protein